MGTARFIGSSRPKAFGAATQRVGGRPRMAVPDDQRRAPPTSGIVRAVRGTNGVRSVAGYHAALAEREGVKMETLPPQFERKARQSGFFGKKAGIGSLSRARSGEGNSMYSTLTRAALAPVPVCLMPDRSREKPGVYRPTCPVERTSLVS